MIATVRQAHLLLLSYREFEVRLQLFEDALAAGVTDIDLSWLSAYLEDPAAKYTYAQRTQLPVDTWKACLMATIMGASLARQPFKSKGELVRKLREVYPCPPGLEAACERFRREVLPLKASLDAWHRYLIGPYVKQYGRKGRGGCVIRNAAGKTFTPAAVESAFTRKAKVRLT